MTVFLGCAFAAKYREGGGMFSVPLQWMLGLRRLRQDALWLELLPATKDPAADAEAVRSFQRQLRAHGLAGRYCLLYQETASKEHDLDSLRCIGLTKRELRARAWPALTFSSISPTPCIPRFSSNSSAAYSAISTRAKFFIG
ncbi:MAG: hypothetical protein ABIU29_07400 [Chthoniobacterales bacterium]